MPRSGHTLASVVMVALSIWACSSTAPDATPRVAAIVVSPARSTLALNAQLPLQAQVQDGSGEIVPDAAIIWTVEDPRIVSISVDGIVTALEVGTSQVAANALGKSGLATITVNPPAAPPASPPATPPATPPAPPSSPSPTPTTGAVATVTVTGPSKKVKRGSTLQLAATAKDNKGTTVPNQSYTWSSSNTNTATVSGSGVVTGKRKGDVTITAQIASSGGKSGSLKIEVK
jgi:uncharacterized protein YjdB